MPDHDRGYKLLFSQPRMVEDLLRGFVGEPWVGRLDFSTLEKVSASYVSDALRQREGDLLWRGRWKAGEGWVYVYLLFEFQSEPDPFMAIRVMAYVALLYQDLVRTKELGPSGRLPPVVPVVLYNGVRRWWPKQDVSGLIEVLPGGPAAYRPRMRYLLVDEGRLPETALGNLSNVAAALMRLERSEQPAEVREVVGTLVERLTAPETRELRRAFSGWIRWVLLPGRLPGVEIPEADDLGEVKAMLEETVIDWTKQWKKEGLRAGLREGRREGRREGEVRIVVRLLEQKFGPLDPESRQRIDAASPRQLLAWSRRILTAETLGEVFRRPGRSDPRRP